MSTAYTRRGKMQCGNLILFTTHLEIILLSLKHNLNIPNL